MAALRAYGRLLRRELTIAVRAGGGAGLGVAFFLIAVLLVPLGIGPDLALLSKIAPGMIWVAALLAALLSLDRMFQADLEDGTLEVMATGSLPLEALAAVKAFSHWATTGLPLLLAAPVLALTLGLSPDTIPWLVASLALGSPALSFIGAIGAALTVGVRRGGLVLSLLVLPLYVPTLIFGARSIELTVRDQDPTTAYLLLAAITLGTVGIAPLAAAAALRINLR